MNLVDKKRKLCVAGCSWSDYTCVEKTYGEILAKDIGFDYVHEGAGCGSNHRIWRRITNHIINGNLTQDDIIIIQYTEATRTEFWSSLPFPSYKHESPEEEASHDNGRILKWKMGSYKWQHHKIEKEFHQIYENYFVGDGYSRDFFTVNNFNFQHMLMNLKMNVIFVISHRIGFWKKENFLDYFRPFVYNDVTHGNGLYNLRENDHCHLNQLGHEVTAESLKNHLNTLKLI